MAKLTPSVMYMRGWMNAVRDEGMKEGPSNHRDPKMREAYITGFNHGDADREMAQRTALEVFGPTMRRRSEVAPRRSNDD